MIRFAASTFRASIAAMIALVSTPASAAVLTLGFPDVVLEFFDSGAGPIAGPYGNARRNGIGFGPVSPNVILGFDTVTSNGYVSLPTGSFITLGFTDEIITNGPGNDIFISEIGRAEEEADIFVSSNLINFILLGTAKSRPFPSTVESFDLAAIGFGAGDVVRAIRVVGRDTAGAAPGFDLNAVQITSTSFLPGNPGSPGAVPEPASWALMIAGFGLVGSAMRRRTKARVTFA